MNPASQTTNISRMQLTLHAPSTSRRLPLLRKQWLVSVGLGFEGVGGVYRYTATPVDDMSLPPPPPLTATPHFPL